MVRPSRTISAGLWSLMLIWAGFSSMHCGETPKSEDEQVTQEDASPQVPQWQEGAEVSMPVGTIVRCRLLGDITTRSNKAGDVVELRALERVIYDGHPVLEENSMLVGKLLHCQPAGDRKVASFALQVSTLEVSTGRQVGCITKPVRFSADRVGEDAAPGDRAAWVSHAKVQGNDLLLGSGAVIDVEILSPIRFEVPLGSI